AMPVVARRAGTGAMPAGAGRAGQGAMPGLAQGAVAKRKLFYPSIVGDGKDPNDIGHRFNFYCVTGPVSDNMNVWKHGILLRKVVNFEE
ncbi:hypothetical protein, partial [Enterococcus faecium]